MIGNGISAYGQLTNKITPSCSIISYCVVPPVYSSPLWRLNTAGISHLPDNGRFPALTNRYGLRPYRHSDGLTSSRRQAGVSPDSVLALR